MADEQDDIIQDEVQNAETADFGGGMLSQEEMDSLLAAAQHEEEMLSAQAGDSLLPDMEEPAPVAYAAPEPPPVISLPSFDTVPVAAEASHSSMGRVRDIPLEVTVELGRTRLLIKDILELGTGSIIELDKLAGEPVDLFANGLLVARGEVIVIDDNFGVRVTEIITAADRKREADANERAA